MFVLFYSYIYLYLLCCVKKYKKRVKSVQKLQEVRLNN